MAPNDVFIEIEDLAGMSCQAIYDMETGPDRVGRSVRLTLNGVPALTILPCEEYRTLRWEGNKQIKEHLGWTLELWEKTGGVTRGNVVLDHVDIIAPHHVDIIRERAVKTLQGLNYCRECGVWAEPSKGHYFSFAGWVCNDCYDPVRHQGPDTRGD